MAQVHGTSKYIQSNDQLLGAADFYDFAPAPCICCGCCCPSTLKGRTFLKVFDNRLTFNMPCALFGPCTCDERCISDNPKMIFFDRQPNRIGMCCVCVPATCCGPPVIFVRKPILCCCIDVSSCYGETIQTAGCNCYGCKKCCCFGAPCYTLWACTMFAGIKDGSTFLAKWQQALQAYQKRADLPEKQMAIFAAVDDSMLDHKGAQQVQVAPSQNEMS